MQTEKLPTARITSETKLNEDQLDSISVEDYLEHYAEHHYEYVYGSIVKMSPIRDVHYIISKYISNLLTTYLTINPIGLIREDPFVMRMAKDLWRMPDIQVILNENQQNLKSTYMDGGADICIEVVSPTSDARDYGEKFTEYEKYGVKEYWLIDPIRKQATFHRLSEEKLYQRQEIDEYYETPLLPRLRLHVSTLWQPSLPDIVQTVKSVQDMLEG